MARRIVFQVHLWLGLAAGLLLTLVCVSGSLLVFLPEVEAWQHRNLTALRQPAPYPLPATMLEQAVETARDGWPQATVSRILLPEHDRRTVAVLMREKAQPLRYVYVDPGAGRVLGHRVRSDGFWAWLQRFHRNLLLDAKGLLANGWLSWIAIVLGVTGLYLWPGWKRLRRGLTIRWNAPRQQFYWDVHSTVGFWTLTPLLLFGITGVAFTWNAEFRVMVEGMLGPAQAAAAVRFEKTGQEQAPIGQIYASAQEAIPGGVVTILQLPGEAGAPVTAFVRSPGEWREVGSNRVYVHPGSASVLSVTALAEATVSSRVLAWVNPAHTGRFGGLWMRSVYFMVGMTPALLFVTGVYLWLRRTMGRRRPGGRKGGGGRVADDKRASG